MKGVSNRKTNRAEKNSALMSCLEVMKVVSLQRVKAFDVDFVVSRQANEVRAFFKLR